MYRALEESRARGFLGPVAIETQVEHASGFSRVWHEVSPQPPDSFLDLGSGGGLPGLVLLEEWRGSGVLLDSMVKRTSFLKETLLWEGAPPLGRVVNGRAEELSRSSEFDGMFSLVTARSFGPPAVTAECAVRFLRLEGVLIVSEPPADDGVNRWDVRGLAKLGIHPEGRLRKGAAYQILRKVKETPSTYPRDVGVPSKNPLF
ncbi:MAG: class I SAM-dependent methyltransferase [Acidobacteriota bacterium]|nr:class I SAM-dependent methyltransferase [Acidobacteriota bacterium]